MKKILILFWFLSFFLFLSPSQVLAAKKRVWKTTTTTVKSSNSGFGVSAKLTGWKQYLNVTFKGLSNTNGVTYELTYLGNNTEQGVFGNVKPSEGNVITRSIYFGTCSHGACVTHKNISDVKLVIKYKTSDGQSVTKKYKVKY